MSILIIKLNRKYCRKSNLQYRCFWGFGLVFNNGEGTFVGDPIYFLRSIILT